MKILILDITFEVISSIDNIAATFTFDLNTTIAAILLWIILQDCPVRIEDFSYKTMVLIESGDK